MNDSALNNSTFSVTEEEIDSAIDLDGNEMMVRKLRASAKIPRDRLYPPPDEEDFHKIIYEDVVLSLYYQIEAINKIKMSLSMTVYSVPLISPMSGSTNSNSIKN